MVEVRALTTDQVQAIYGKFIDGLPFEQRYSYSIQDPVFFYWFRREFGNEFTIKYQEYSCQLFVDLDDVEMVELLMKI